MDNFDKTLNELWEEVGGKPFDAEHLRDGPAYIVGRSKNGLTLIGERQNQVACFQPIDPSWRLAPKPVPHWPALRRGASGMLYVSEEIFPNEAEARRVFPNDVIRLATELPPIMIGTETRRG